MQRIFQRYEEKYLITEVQREVLSRALLQYMVPDRFEAYLVQNLYYDTEHWDIIRTSIEKPLYKEKMRLRCYGEQNSDSKIFLELKKKYKGIVHKRRVVFSNIGLFGNEIGDLVAEEASQISHELAFHLKAKQVCEKMYISHKRCAFIGIADKGLRLTFDTDIRYRVQGLTFEQPDRGTPVLSSGAVIMEIKMPGGMPLWLARMLSEHKVYPTSFSKYGACYVDHMQKQRERERSVTSCLNLLVEA